MISSLAGVEVEGEEEVLFPPPWPPLLTCSPLSPPPGPSCPPLSLLAPWPLLPSPLAPLAHLLPPLCTGILLWPDMSTACRVRSSSRSSVDSMNTWGGGRGGKVLGVQQEHQGGEEEGQGPR